MPDPQHVLAGLVQAEYVLRKYGQWQAADACRDAHQLLAGQTARSTP